jgi:DNA polymerase elongation subunit (family B)
VSQDKRIVAFDFETDPFEYGRVPEPFCVGIYDGETYLEEWGTGEDCALFVLDVADAYDDDVIFYAHNGGKFDFHFLLPYAETLSDIVMIGSRIVQIRINGKLFRDSYSAVPAALKSHDKGEIDYALMERDVRHLHTDVISEYLKRDCVSLYTLMDAFKKEFGDKLTMAAAALEQLSKFHEWDKMTGDVQDARFRQYYFGGRVEFFEKGYLEGSFQCYDVNSMYPSVMQDFEHPVTDKFHAYTGKLCYNDKVFENFSFAEIDATSEGALPWRDPEAKGIDQKLLFPHGRKLFYASGHEVRMAVKLGALKIHHIKKCFVPDKTSNFKAFIQHFYNARLKAKAEGDKTYDLFYKLVMNSAYGKFAQDPSKFKEYGFFDGELPPMGEGWELVWKSVNGIKRIYKRPSRQPLFTGRKNVATAASITAASRARLLEGLRNSTRPVYCDTDSIICESLSGVPMDDKALGAWKLEKSGHGISIAGRKLYALHTDDGYSKIASKGVRATGEEIARIAKGETLEFHNQAPTFTLGKQANFVKREIRMK